LSAAFELGLFPRVGGSALQRSTDLLPRTRRRHRDDDASSAVIDTDDDG